MKSLLIAVLLLVVAGTSFAQRGPGHGPRDHRGPGNHGRDSVRKGPPCNLMADSCFQILLGKLSADDAAALTAALDAQKAFMDQVNQIRAAAKAAREAHDTAAFRAAMEQLKALRRQGKEIGKTIREIMHRNNTAVREALLACCGEPPHGPRDSNDTKGPGHHQHILEVGNIKPNPVPAGITATSMDLRLKVESTVTITINDQLGNIVKTVTDGTLAVGEHVVSLDLTGLTTGGYLVRVQSGTDVQTRRLVIH
jgi:hypothetical protein